ncbi:hypothetical protein [Methylobacterium sp. Leaf117]|uniref:hypothetical protein n=1 Tax=Methylobacterium sp. Leaf117 TaxID=1736260 RepID=UPI0012E27B55|nr:hypothetical protein [Methylobacterium sp. Leaf117]
MNMQSYLAEIKHAAEISLKAIWEEHKQVQISKATLDRLTKQTHRDYERAERIADSDDIDDITMATGLHWETYFGVDKERFNAEAFHKEQESVLQARKFSRAALSGTVLQLAKQGISIVHGKLSDAPTGPNLKGAPLSSVIWQARNQALHWEEGSFSKSVTDCFEGMSTKWPTLSAYRDKNLAFEVVEVLGWTHYEAFEIDMMSLA